MEYEKMINIVLEKIIKSNNNVFDVHGKNNE
ncbi:MAG: hypothetical protein ACI93R_001627 [Flavobacteriales bacterium]|jgi:hypothetical protein